MNLIDWVIVRRLLGSVALTLLVLFGILLLVESMDTDRFEMLSGVGGIPLAFAGASSARRGAGWWILCRSRRWSAR